MDWNPLARGAFYAYGLHNVVSGLESTRKHVCPAGLLKSKSDVLLQVPLGLCRAHAGRVIC